MDINVKNTGYQQELTLQSNNHTENPAAAKSQDFVPVGKSQKSDENNELYKKLGLTKEQFEKLCEEYPGFETLKETQQLELINTKLTVQEAPKSENNTETKSTSLKGLTSQNGDVQNPATAELTEQTEEVFSPKKYSELSNKEKMLIYAQELAKNRFIYGDAENHKSVEAWDALTPEQQKNLVDKEVGGLNKAKAEGLFDEKSIGRFFELKMNQLQAANFLGVDFETFSKDLQEGKTYALDAIHDYILSVPDEEKSEGQKLYMKENAFLSNAVVKACIENNIGEYSDAEGMEYILSGSEISENLKKLGKTAVQVEYDYLKNKTNLNQEEKTRLESLGKYIKRKAVLHEKASQRVKDKSLQVDYGRLDALAKTEYGKLFNSAQTVGEKAMVLGAYIKKATADMTPEQKSEFLAQLGDELLNDPANLKLIESFYAVQLQIANKKERMAMAQEDAGIAPELNATNIEKLGADQELLAAVQETQQNIQENDSERGTALMTTAINNSTEDQAVILGEEYSGNKDVRVQNAYKEKVFSFEKSENQMKGAVQIKENSNEEVIADAASRANELNEDIQNEALELLTKGSKLATKKANESGTVYKMAEENQTEAFKTMKNNIETLFENDEEAIEQLNILSDQISKSHKDNQLAMHEEIMKSEFSAVQEHAAANIKDYDPTVQSKAIDVVYETGNSKAVQAVVENLEKMPPEVQKTEVTRLVGEIALNNAVSSGQLENQIMGGTLTAQQLRELSPAQRREYFAKQFDEAPPAKKLEILMKLASVSSGIHQRTIYTVIARFSPSLLKGMVDRGMGKTMLESGLPIDAVNKIITVMKSSTNNEVIQQLKELRADSSFDKYFIDDKDEADNENNKNFTVPNDLKGAFAARIDSPTYEKLKKHKSTMYIKS